MNSLIDRLMKEGIGEGSETWVERNADAVFEYCAEHYGAEPNGELGFLIASQAMDAGRTRFTFEPAARSCDEAFAAEAWMRGTAEVNSFMGFDYDEATTHGSASDQMEIQDLHNTAPVVITRVESLRCYLRLSGNQKMRDGFQAAIHRNRQGLIQPEFGRSGVE